MFYTRNNVHLVGTKFAKSAGFKGKSIIQSIMTAGGKRTEFETMLYSVTLLRINRGQVQI